MPRTGQPRRVRTDAGRPNFTALRDKGAAHPIEQVGAHLRGLMSWVDRPITETA